jgi:hypothetical protein
MLQRNPLVGSLLKASNTSLGKRERQSEFCVVGSVQCKRCWTIRKSGKGIGISQHDHLFLVRYIAPHVALVDHIRHKTFRLFRRNIHAGHPQRTVEHCHGDPVTLFRHNPARMTLSIRSEQVSKTLTYTRRNNPLMQISRAFSSVSQIFRSTRRRSHLSKAVSKPWISPFRIAEIKGV